MDERQIKFIISNTPPFNKLKKRELDNFISLCEIKEYRNGEIVYNEGSPPDYFYLLLQGRIIALTKEKDKESEIELLKRGTHFGIISLFTDEPHSVTTKSIEESFVARVQKENFKEFLKKCPVIALDFSHSFSQRVKSRYQPKKIFQCRRIAVTGLPSSGKTTYLLNLGLRLKEQTKKNIICIQTSNKDKFDLISIKGAVRKEKILYLDEFKEETVSSYVLRDDIDCLLVKTGKKSGFACLLNFFSESYHYILYEVPLDFLREYFDDIVCPGNYLHFVSIPQKEELVKIGGVIEEFRKKDPSNKDKIKVILNEASKSYSLSFEEKKGLLNQAIYANLPYYKHSDYYRALVRISRQIGERVVGLALGSGGAYCFSHIGVLKVLEENDIYIDVVSGSSMGALVAALWACGFGMVETEGIVRDFGKKLSSFSGVSLPFKGILRAEYLEGILKNIFKQRTFFDLKHGLKLAAFDFLKRESVVLEEGLIYKAVAASCAMPGIFEPIRFKKNILLDGGVLSPLPTDILLKCGVHKIIAVNIAPSQQEAMRKHGQKAGFHIFDFIFGSIETMQREFVQQAVKTSDVVIHPELSDLGWTDFDKVEEFVKRGERVAKDKLDEIKKLVI